MTFDLMSDIYYSLYFISMHSYIQYIAITLLIIKKKECQNRSANKLNFAYVN